MLMVFIKKENMKEIHGHELIKLLLEINKPLTLDEIKELAITRIGENVTYYTCSESSMNTEGMINFLRARNKLIKKDGGFMINIGEVCEHD